MSQHKRNSVRILNPAGGPGYTSQKKAVEYVQAGRARIGRDEIGEVLEFLTDNPRNQRVVSCAALREQTVDHAGYDSIGSVARFGGAVKYTYREHMENQPYTLKRVSGGGHFTHWDDKAGFAPRRFNPDRIPAPLIPSRVLVPAEVAA